MSDHIEKWKSPEEKTVIENVLSDDIKNLYAEMAVNKLERTEISSKANDLHCKLNLLKARMDVLSAEHDIIHKKLWDGVYEVYPHLGEYNRLQIRENDKLKSLSIVAPAAQKLPPFFPFGGF